MVDRYFKIPYKHEILKTCPMFNVFKLLRGFEIKIE